MGIGLLLHIFSSGSAWLGQKNVRYLFFQRFFIVMFYIHVDYKKVFEDGPWFWGRVGIFVTTLFPKFNPNTLLVIKMPIWVQLLNLPSHLLHLTIFQNIRNSFDSYIKININRDNTSLSTYSPICVDIDLNI